MPKNPDGRMTVVEHLAELRTRLIISIAAVDAGRDRLFFFSPDDHPLLPRVLQGRDRHGSTGTFIFTGPLDAFVTRLKIATYGGIVLALPVWL